MKSRLGEEMWRCSRWFVSDAGRLRSLRACLNEPWSRGSNAPGLGTSVPSSRKPRNVRAPASDKPRARKSGVSEGVPERSEPHAWTNVAVARGACRSRGWACCPSSRKLECTNPQRPTSSNPALRAMFATMLRALLTLASLTMTAPAQDRGISLELAKSRESSIGRISYDLRFVIEKGMKSVAGEVEIRFATSKTAGPLVLDWEGEALSELELNGKKLGTGDWKQVEDHIVISTKLGRRNTLRAKFRSRVAATGTPLTRYYDKKNDEEFFYTLLVPSDAHRLFPCFDQPSLKAVFGLELVVPSDWQAVGNVPLLGEPKTLEGNKRLLRFGGTQFLPTYLFAFAVGPFEVIDGPVVHFGADKSPEFERPLRIYVRKSKREQLDAETTFALHLNSLRWYERWLDFAYPFAKLDCVLCPGFPYGGMEHAGAIFYRESAFCFERKPSALETLRRSILVYHEVGHQWFGNLVTMRWFDDLWLKEGFATHLSYRVLEELEPERAAWLRFHQHVKPAAYRVDSTLGTIPIWQSLGNLDDAKSNYGPIVYNKAPAVLRALELRVGPDVYKKGLQNFCKQYAFANATWRELLAAIGEAGKVDLGPWAERWIRSAGMPQVRVDWSVADGKIDKARLVQSSAQSWPSQPWPMRVELLVDAPKAPGGVRRVSVNANRSVTEIRELIGADAPQWILPNSDDGAYGLFVLDKQSATAIRSVLLDPSVRFKDPLVRTLAVRALFDTTRSGELPANELAQTVTSMLRDERDPVTHASLLGIASNAIERWIAGEWQTRLRKDLLSMLQQQLEAGELKGLELQTLRRIVRIARDPQLLAWFEGIADGKTKLPGLELASRDRFLLAAAALAHGRAAASERIAKLEKSSKGDVAKWAFCARAAAPDEATKRRYFEAFLELEGAPEQWVSACLSFFHWPGQEAQTLPFLAPALDRLAWIKEHRKIFFMPAWINAFVNAHESEAAREAVTKALANDKLELDIRRKLQQSADSLDRALRIRQID